MLWKSPRSTTGSRGTTALKETGSISKKLNAWLRKSLQVFLFKNLVKGFRNHEVQRFLDQGAPPHMILNYRSGGFAGRKPGIRSRGLLAGRND